MIKALKIFAKIIAWIVGIVLGILLLVFILIRVPFIQDKIAGAVEDYLEKTMETEVSVGGLYLNLPKYIELTDVYIEDQQGDSLAYFHSLEVNTDLLGLLNNHLEVSQFTLEDARARLYRGKNEQTFNYQFVIDAFTKPDTTSAPSKPFTFDIGSIDIGPIRLFMHDSVTQSYIDASWQHLEVDVNSLDLDTMAVEIDQIALESAQFSFDQFSTGQTDSSTSESSTAAIPDIAVNELSINNSAIHFQTLDQLFEAKIGTLTAETDAMSLPETTVQLKSISLAQSDILFRMYSSSATEEREPETTEATENTWIISADQLSLDNNHVKIDLDTITPNTRYFDPTHMEFEGLSAELQNTYYSISKIESTIESIEVTSEDQHANIAGYFLMNDSRMEVKNADINIDQSQVNGNFIAEYGKGQDLMAPSSKVMLDLTNTLVYAEDLIYFVPDAMDLAMLGYLNLNGSVTGTWASLDIKRLTANSTNSSLKLDGRLNNVLNPEQLSYNLTNLELESSSKTVESLLPKEVRDSLPITIPERFDLTASGTGTLSSFRGELDLKSSMGNIQVRADSIVMRDSIPQYAVDIKTKGFNFGKFLNQPNGDLDSLGLDMKLSGSGSDITSLDNISKGTLYNVRYNNYVYDTVRLNANIKKGLVDGNIAVIDDHINLKIEGDMDINPAMHKNRLKITLENADLHTLNFWSDTLTISAKIVTDFSTPDFRHYNGDLAIRSFKASNATDTYKVDSLLVASIEQDGQTSIDIQSDLLAGDFEGNIDLFTVGNAVMQHINQYYNLTGVPSKEIQPTSFALNFNLKRTELITEILIPELEKFRPGRLSAKFDSEEDLLDLRLSIYEVDYAGIEVDSFLLTATSKNKAINSKITIDQIVSANTEVNNFGLNAQLADNSLSTTLSILDSIGQTKYLVKGLFESVDSTYQFLMKDSLILAYESWAVKQNAPLRIADISQAEPTTLTLSKNEQQLSFKTNATDTALHVLFDQFKLATIANAVQKEDDFVNGELNGQVDLYFPASGFTFTGNLNINDLGIEGISWGDFNLTTTQLDSTLYEAELKLLSDINDVVVTSTYDIANFDELSLDVDINKFELHSVQPLVKTTLDSLSGNLTADITLSNGFIAPVIDGSITLNNTIITPQALSTPLLIDDETIEFKKSVIQFGTFSITDADDNIAFLNGEVEMVNTALYNFDLRIYTNDFLLVNSTKEDNSLVYGKLRTDGKLNLNGSSLRPTIVMDMKIAEESEITYVVPQTRYNEMSTENVIEFINVDSTKIETPQDILVDSLHFEGISLTSTLEVDENVTFNVVIDPITGDQLSLRGEATLNFELERNGDMQLAGRYSVREGSYNFSFYKLVQRKFIIEDGSSVTWTGDPYKAQLDIDAYNRVEAPPIDLIITRDPSATQQQQFRQRLPFLVYVRIDGELMKPEISFEIDMPEDKRNAFGGQVYAAIMDLNTRESDLNKQVFALLLLQRFISDDPLKSEGGLDIEDKARRSVSRIMSDQLNRLASNVDGLNLNFDLQSYQDYSSGTAQSSTQLELGVSKTLLNDRLEVKVAGNVNIEGQRQSNLADYVGDLALEYQITDDGRLRITGFRRNDFDVVSGEIIETGAGLIYVRDYNSFKELFKKVEDE